MTRISEGGPQAEKHVKLEKMHAHFTEGRSQSLAHLSPEQLHGIFQMLAPTMREVQEDNTARNAPNRFEEVLARYALGGTTDIELDLNDTSDAAPTDDTT